MPLTLDSLAVLDAIARRGSFAAAAAELGKVPSALTYTVRRLEEELDVLIFDRRGRRAQLTAAGLMLLEQGRELLRAADDLACRVREVASGWEVELRIALDAVIAFDQLRPLLTDFYRLGAPTRLRFSTEVLDGGWDALLAGRADLAIGLGSDPPAPAATSARLGVRPLGELRFLWCVAPDHPLASAPEPLEAENLLAHRAVALADSSRSLPSRSAGLLSGQDTLTVGSLEQKIAMQLAGLGVGWLPEPFVREHLAAGRLVARRTTRAAPVSITRYAWRRSARGKALAWWLQRLDVARVRARLLAGPLPAAAASDSRAEPGPEPAARPPATRPRATRPNRADGSR